MKFTAYKADLLDDLKHIAKCVPVKDLTPILSAVKITADATKITLEATDLNISVAAVIPANVEETGTVCVSARYLLDVVSKLPEETVTLSDNGQLLNVTSGGAHFDMPTFEEQDFPSIAFDAEPELKIRAPQFKELVLKTAFAADKDISRPTLQGVNFKTRTENGVTKLQAFATNTHRVAAYLDGLIRCDGEPPDINIIVPVNSLRVIAAAVADDEDSFVTLVKGERTLTVKFDNLLFKTRLTGGEFPACDKVLFNDEQTNTALIETAPLKETIGRAQLISRKSEYHTVIFELHPNSIDVSASNEDCGDMHEAIPAKCDEEVKIGFNIGYLTDFLSVAKCSRIRVKYGDKLTPFKMSDADDEDSFIYVVTPVRL